MRWHGYFFIGSGKNCWANRRNTDRIFNHVIEEYVYVYDFILKIKNIVKIEYVYDFTLID